jgi:serine protease
MPISAQRAAPPPPLATDGRRSRARVSLGIAVLSGAALLTWMRHAPVGAEPDGLAAADPQAFAAVDVDALGTVLSDPWATGAVLVDFVEPAHGEGGSEAKIRARAEQIAADFGVSLALAGPYAEGEHLWRIEGAAPQVTAAARALAGDGLVEGVEAEVTLALPDDARSAFAGDAAIQDGIEPSKPSKPRVTPNDPMFALQWHMEAIHAPEAWVTTRGAGAVVAVIDTGVAYKDAQWKAVQVRAVPDLAGARFTEGMTFIDNALPDGLDDHAHGTHVAGTIAQSTNNGVGVTGVAYESTIMPLKVLGGDGRGSVAGIANAIRYAADNGAKVINMSLGGPLPSRVLAKAVEYAHDKGVTVVCAAGNEKKSRVSYPAAYKGSVAVAATDFEGKRSFYSNWGKELDLSAPGGDTRADKNRDGHPDGVLQNTIRIQKPAENDYLWFQGTSMAAPHAAGVAALVVSAGVTRPAEVERIMKATARHPNKVKWDKEYGAGIIDAQAAVAMARQQALPERAGWALGLGLLTLGGFGAGALRGRTRLTAGGGGFVAGLVLALGVFGLPLSMGVASLFGVWAFGSPLFASALLPAAATVLGFGVARLRGLWTGLSLGWAAVLAHAAVAMPVVLDGVPGGLGWDRAFLAVNAALLLVLAGLASRR